MEKSYKLEHVYDCYLCLADGWRNFPMKKNEMSFL